MFIEMIPLSSTSIDPGLFAEEMAVPALPAVIVEAIIYSAIGVVIYEAVEIAFEKL
ncbi:MAG: hypothetical protein ABIN61_08770 [candidate division WOR-3 bacterium]